MQSQNVVVKVAAGVTGLFMLTVGVVLAWPWLTAPVHEAPRFVQNFNQQLIAPLAELPRQEEQPVPVVELKNLRGKVIPAKEFALSAPQTHGNLTVFLIHGKDTVKGANILTLQEGLEQNLAVVHETGGGQLFIDNRSNTPLFIQAGDIVKGGTQDRTLPFDMLIPANTTRTPIVAMCVEQGRSFPRAGEVSTSFETATEQLPGRDLRLAASRRSQAQVWNGVRDLQTKIAKNAGGTVKAPLSQTSLQLSLEHQRVQGAIQDCMTNLAPTVAGKDDAIGYVVVVNGQIQSADVYGSASLFRKLWPKLIRASAVGALAEAQPGKFEAPTPEAVRAFLQSAENGQASRIQNGNASHVIRQETAGQVQFDTCDAARDNVVLHRSLLAK